MLGTGPLSAKTYTEKNIDQLEREKLQFQGYFAARIQRDDLRSYLPDGLRGNCLSGSLEVTNNYHIDFLVGQL